MYFAHKYEPWTAECETFGEGASPNDAQGEVKAFRTLPAADYVQGQSDINLLLQQYYYPDTPIALCRESQRSFSHQEN